jgi:hypothetical protein
VSEKWRDLDASQGESLVDDPDFPWDGGNPYATVNGLLKDHNEPLLGPGSSAGAVYDAGFVLQGADEATEEKDAWTRLRAPQERLLIDFFHYPLPALRLESLDAACLDRPMPVAEPDLMSMVADVKVELDARPELPAQLPACPLPTAGLIDFGLADLIPAPICPHSPALSDIIEVDDD